uniref:Uncharacterized protein n=1 Tax=Romanomermis culicivorax TaxID=13658 RepID=A0A915L259_ROMCU
SNERTRSIYWARRSFKCDNCCFSCCRLSLVGLTGVWRPVDAVSLPFVASRSFVKKEPFIRQKNET